MAGTLYLPERRRGQGSGHLRRALDLLSRDPGESRIFFPAEGSAGELSRFEALVNASASVEALEEGRFVDTREEAMELLASGAFDRVVFDQQELSREDLALSRNAALRIGIDTGGEHERFLDVTFHALPRLPGESPANREGSAYLELPDQRRERWPERIERVLLTLGGEDSSGLARRLASLLGETFPELSFHFTENGRLHGPEIDEQEPQQALREELHRFDLVVLHYGMTLFEALYARVPILALPVSPYHRSLTEALDLDCALGLDIEEIAPELGRIVIDPTESVERCRRVAPEAPADLQGELAELLPPGHRNPLFPGQGRFDGAEARLEERTYYRCESSGLLYMRRFAPQRVEYNERYFFEEYEKQYGRTYLEDFESIRRAGRRRLKGVGRVRRHRPGGPSRRTLRALDVGCAYGPFLAAAEEAGYTPFGIDLAKEAVEYVRENLGYPAEATTIEELDPEESFGVEQFDLITMWYVIEHIPDLDTLLSRVAGLLAPGGVFAFSTPNGEGVSATTNRRAFLQNSPEDHLTIWEPSRLESILGSYGFDVARVTVTGHHPERFPSIRDRPKSVRSRMLMPLLSLRSRVAGLGDTFECYCRRRVG